MEILQTTISSPLGFLKLKASEAALVACSFAEADDGIYDNSDILQNCRVQLQNYFDGKLKQFDLPLNMEGTPFQIKVWKLLEGIPFGETQSYAAMAQRYGEMRAIRAVAAANGRNPFAIILPCHRVIGSNRSLTGYAGGLWRKKWLLEHESNIRHAAQQSLFD